VASLYKRQYWDAVKADELPAGLDYLMFDFAINAGPGRAIKTMQKAIGTNPDGAIGPKTMQALKDADPTDLIAKFSVEKELFYKALPTFATFGKCWRNWRHTSRSRGVISGDISATLHCSGVGRGRSGTAGAMTTNVMVATAITA
jgi:lysozyme family protein